jgi:hypothetical protein
MNFFSKIAAISSTLKGVLVLVVLVAIGVGGYFTYTRIMAIAQRRRRSARTQVVFYPASRLNTVRRAGKRAMWALTAKALFPPSIRREVWPAARTSAPQR